MATQNLTLKVPFEDAKTATIGNIQNVTFATKCDKNDTSCDTYETPV